MAAPDRGLVNHDIVKILAVLARHAAKHERPCAEFVRVLAGLAVQIVDEGRRRVALFSLFRGAVLADQQDQDPEQHHDQDDRHAHGDDRLEARLPRRVLARRLDEDRGRRGWGGARDLGLDHGRGRRRGFRRGRGHRLRRGFGERAVEPVKDLFEHGRGRGAVILAAGLPGDGLDQLKIGRLGKHDAEYPDPVFGGVRGQLFPQPGGLFNIAPGVAGIDNAVGHKDDLFAGPVPPVVFQFIDRALHAGRAVGEVTPVIKPRQIAAVPRVGPGRERERHPHALVKQHRADPDIRALLADKDVDGPADQKIRVVLLHAAGIIQHQHDIPRRRAAWVMIRARSRRIPRRAHANSRRPGIKGRAQEQGQGFQVAVKHAIAGILSLFFFVTPGGLQLRAWIQSGGKRHSRLSGNVLNKPLDSGLRRNDGRAVGRNLPKMTDGLSG